MTATTRLPRSLSLVTAAILMAGDASAAPLPVARVSRPEPVLFEKDVLPILRRSCLACHSESERRGDLVLESVAAMRKGGDSGPAIVPGKAAESLLFTLAAHRDEPVMPPAKNDVAAPNLSAGELGLLALWIDQGAKSSGTATVAGPRSWRPIATGFTPALAATLAADGQLVAVARGNRLLLHHPASGRLVTELVDPALPAAAHRDLVEAVAFNREGDLLASGGYREAKVWRRPRDVRAFTLAAGGPVTAVAATADGRLVATAAGGAVRLWSGADAKAGPVLVSGTGRIMGAAFTPDGSRLYAVAEQGRIRGWRTADGGLVGDVDAGHPARGFAIMPADPAAGGDATGPLLVVGGGDGLLRTFRVPDALPTKLLDAAEPGRRMSVSRDGKRVAVTGPPERLRLFAITDDGGWQPRGEWRLDRGPATSLCLVKKDGAEDIAVATGHADGWIELRVPGQTAPVRRFGAGGVAIERLAAAADGNALVTGDGKGAVAAWRGGLGDAAEPLGGAVVEGVTATAFHPGRRLLAVAGTSEGRPAIVVRRLGKETAAVVLRGHAAAVRDLAFIGDGGRIVSGGDDKTVRLWDWQAAAANEPVAVETPAAAVVAVGADSERIAAAGADHIVRVWPVADPAKVLECRGHTAAVLAVGFDPGGRPFSVSADGSVRIWKTEDGTLASTWSPPAAPIAAGLSADRQSLVVATADGGLRTHLLASGQVAKVLATAAGRPRSVGLSADGSRVIAVEAVGSGGVVRVYDTAGGRLLEAIDLPAAAAVAADGDAAILHVTADGGVVRHRGSLLRHFAGGTAAITGLAVTAEGRVVAAAADGQVRGYALENGQPAGTAAHGGPITAFAATADGGLIATGGKGDVRFWKADLSAAGPGATGLAAEVAALAVTPDGSRAVVAVAAAGSPVTVHDAATGILLERFAGHAAPVADVAVTTNGGVVSAGTDAIWRWPLAAVAAVARHGGAVTAIAPVPTAPRELVTGCADGLVRRVGLPEGRIAGQFQHGGPVAAVAVRPDGGRIASVGESKSVKLWRPDGQLVVESRGDLRRAAAVARITRQQGAAQARHTLAKQQADAAEKDLPVRTEGATKAKAALDAADGELKQKRDALAAADRARIAAEQGAIAASTEARAASFGKATAERLAAAQQDEIKALQEKSTAVAAAAAASPADAARKQAAATAAAAVTAAGQKLKELEATAKTAAQAAAAKAAAANEATKRVGETQKPAAEALVAVQKAEAARKLALQQHTVFARELETATAALPAAREALAAAEAAVAAAKQELEAATAAAADAVAPIRHVAFSPEGSLLATGGDFPAVHLWDGENGTAVGSFVGHAAAVSGLSFLPDGRLVTAAAEPEAIGWEVSPPWKLDRTIGGEAAANAPVDRVLTVDFSSDSRLLLVGGGVPSRSGELAVYSLDDGLRTLHLPEAHDDVVFAARFAPDGRRIASAGADKYLRTFDAGDGRSLRRFEGHTNYVLGVAWKGDGRTLASCGADGAIKVWDAETADQKATIPPLPRHLTSIRFIGDGDTFLTGCGDRVARIHNAGGGLVRAFPALDAWIHAVDVTPGGDIIVAAAADGMVRLWNGTNGQPLADLAAAPEPAAGPTVTVPGR